MTATGSGGQPKAGEEDSLSSQTSVDANMAQSGDEFKETFRIIKEMSGILNTGLDTQSLGVCLRLCDGGVNPTALAKLIKDWRENNS